MWLIEKTHLLEQQLKSNVRTCTNNFFDNELIMCVTLLKVSSGFDGSKSFYSKFGKIKGFKFGMV